MAAMPFTIDEYKRKLQVRAAQATKRHTKAPPTNADFVFDGLQKSYLDFCVAKTLEPDHKLLSALKSKSFVLKLDAFSEEELALHMAFLQKTSRLHQIALSLGSARMNREVKKKFERLGLSKSPAFEKESAALIVKSACAACAKSPHLTRLQLCGIHIAEGQAALLSKALAKCDKLEMLNLGGTGLGDKGVEALSLTLGKRPQLLYANFSDCSFTSDARDHLAKILTLHGTQRDEAAWSASLRGATMPSKSKRPTLLMDLSRNALGDAGIEALCAALFHDKWMLGLNLVDNQLSLEGLKLCRDTVEHNNSTLSVLKISPRKHATPESDSIIRSIDALVPQRLDSLRALSTQSSERRLFLCNLLLEWNVDQDLVLQLCDDAPDSEQLSNQESQFSSDRDDDESSARSASPTPSAPPTPDANQNHIHTIKFLVDRLSAVEAEQQKTVQLVDRLEEENHELRATVKSLREKNRDATPQAMEESVIAQLEASITMLAKQIEVLEAERRHRR